ncbi:19405_t:CDS:1 [Funneliformis geosporum]|uniref:Phosphatidylglycerol/phosphatidylinositol transfer protein n=1 Tax=Funneliformis geosporum TaxID=1117311 RepID=A0A9W4SZE3_9GLOM|nr:19405_t:CDS:1 [Funneliformis geosporum]CAI2184710.1 15780_t:CDS:1 [Funneliformis geosporum]
MKQNFISAFFLLATLLLSHAAPYQLDKRTTSFGPCPVDPPVTLLTVNNISPDPFVKGQVVAVNFTGTSPVDIHANKGINLQLTFLDSDQSPVVEPSVLDFCTITGITCPLLNGTEFSSKVAVTVPDIDNIYMVVSIVDVPNVSYIACAWNGPSSS